MYIKLNFTTPQVPAVWFECVYLAMAYNTNVGATSIANLVSAVNANGTSVVKTAIAFLDTTTSEIVNTTITPGTMPLVHFWYNGTVYDNTTPGQASQAAATLTFRSYTEGASVVPSYYLRLGQTTFALGDGNGGTGSSNLNNTFVLTGSPTTNLGNTFSNTSSSPVALSSNRLSANHTWNFVTGTGTNTTTLGACYSYFISITPYSISWAANKQAYYKTGWNMSYSSWTGSSTASQVGPFTVSQYTRLDVWNTDANGIIPVCWINGQSPSYRGTYYGLSYGGTANSPSSTSSTLAANSGDLKWDPNLNFSQNPLGAGAATTFATPTFNTTFSVANTINATPNTTGLWPNTDYNSSGTALIATPNLGVQVTHGTHIRPHQDQAPLVATNQNYTATAGSGTNNFITGNYPLVYKNTIAENSTTRSAFYGQQGASLFDNGFQGAQFAKWPNTETPPKGSFMLQPLLWNRADYNNIGGLISDKSGTYLFNGDYAAGDEFTSGGTTYAIWPLADGWNQRIGYAVPKK